MVVAARRQEAAITFISDEALVTLLQLPFERGQVGGPGGGVLLHLVAIATDDVAPPGQRHSLGLVFDVFLTGQNQRHEGAGIVEHEFTHEFIGALAHAEDVENVLATGAICSILCSGLDASTIDVEAPYRMADWLNLVSRLHGSNNPMLALCKFEDVLFAFHPVLSVFVVTPHEGQDVANQ